MLTNPQATLVATKQRLSFQNIHFPTVPARDMFTLDMISSIAAKRTTSSMPSPSIISTTTKSTITATGEWRN